MRKEDQERAVREVVNRVLTSVLAGGNRNLENTIADTVYWERDRISRGPDGSGKFEQFVIAIKLDGLLGGIENDAAVAAHLQVDFQPHLQPRVKFDVEVFR